MRQHLEVGHRDGDVSDRALATAHLGEGYATRLYQHANAEAEIFHTIPAHRSDDGDEWIRKVGGYEVDDALVIDDCCCDPCDT